MHALEIINTKSFNTETELAGNACSHHTLGCNAKLCSTTEDTVYHISYSSMNIHRCFPMGINGKVGTNYYLENNFFCSHKNESGNKTFLK